MDRVATNRTVRGIVGTCTVEANGEWVARDRHLGHDNTGQEQLQHECVACQKADQAAKMTSLYSKYRHWSLPECGFSRNP
jgi:hypothetical protein